jgi:hypothetical protein
MLPAARTTSRPRPIGRCRFQIIDQWVTGRLYCGIRACAAVGGCRAGTTTTAGGAGAGAG